MSTRTSLSVPSAVGFVVATPVVVWAVVGKHDTGDDYAVGPYRVPLWLEYAVGAVAVVVLVASTISVVRRRGAGRLDTLAVALTCLVTGLWAAAWRVATSGGDGANIGAGLVLFAMPAVIGALLVGAVVQQHTYRQMPRVVFVGGITGSVAIAATLYVLIFA